MRTLARHHRRFRGIQPLPADCDGTKPQTNHGRLEDILEMVARLARSLAKCFKGIAMLFSEALALNVHRAAMLGEPLQRLLHR